MQEVREEGFGTAKAQSWSRRRTKSTKSASACSRTTRWARSENILAVGKVAVDQQARAYVRCEEGEEKDVRRTQQQGLARRGLLHVSNTRPVRLVDTASCDGMEPQCKTSRSSSARRSHSDAHGVDTSLVKEVISGERKKEKKNAGPNVAQILRVKTYHEINPCVLPPPKVRPDHLPLSHAVDIDAADGPALRRVRRMFLGWSAYEAIGDYELWVVGSPGGWNAL